MMRGFSLECDQVKPQIASACSMTWVKHIPLLCLRCYRKLWAKNVHMHSRFLGNISPLGLSHSRGFLQGLCTFYISFPLPARIHIFEKSASFVSGSKIYKQDFFPPPNWPEMFLIVWMMRRWVQFMVKVWEIGLVIMKIHAASDIDTFG